MKKLFALVLVVVLALPLTGCGHEEAKSAYEKLTYAQAVLDDMASDLRTACRAQQEDPAVIQEGGFAYLAQEMNLTGEELSLGAGRYLCQDDWDSLTEEQQFGLQAGAEVALKIYTLSSNGTFEFSCPCVVFAYQFGGKLPPALDAINQVGAQLDSLKEDQYYGDLVDYHFALKSYAEYMLEYPGADSLDLMLDDFQRLAAQSRETLDGPLS